MTVMDRIENLPSLSDVVTQFLEISRREFITARDFERVICKDQALVARLLKVANSGLYGKSRSVETIPQAMVLIGLDNLKKMVYAVSTEGLMRRELRCYCYPDKGFWLHSMGVGLTCRAVAEKAGTVDLGGEEAFVAGLLHDVGQLLLDDDLDPEAGPRAVTLEEEVAACGIDHGELVGHIATRWSLSDRIAEAARYHHNPCPDGEWHTGAACVYLAETACTTWGVGTQPWLDLGEEIAIEPLIPVLEAIQMSPERLTEVLWDARQRLAGLEKLYNED